MLTDDDLNLHRSNIAEHGVVEWLLRRAKAALRRAQRKQTTAHRQGIEALLIAASDVAGAHREVSRLELKRKALAQRIEDYEQRLAHEDRCQPTT
jgi:hypothetical protein